MSKLRSVYRCQQCGHTTAKWLGQCPDCESWNTLAEEVVETAAVGAKRSGGAASLTRFSSEALPLAQLDTREVARVSTGLGELDRLLGGGLVGGQVTLLAGPPGIGKSTLMLQAAARLAEGGGGRKVLYVSGEESLGQVSARAKRLELRSETLYVVSETDLGRILEEIRRIQPAALVLDSVQTVCHPELGGSAGSVGQVRECAAEILREAKGRDMPAFLLGHVTKEGALAGPRVLEHIVDTVLYFDTERHHGYRVLRVHKNRFGPSPEIGIFEMGENGLAEVADASSIFLEERAAGSLPGRAAAVAMEGSRPLVAEVQALVIPTRYPLPRRMATGIDLNRALVLIAALEKHLRLRLESKDVFVSLAGGLKPKDPALDLAVCMAILSSARDAALPPGDVFVGEVGLLGQVGRVSHVGPRLGEAAKHGFTRAFVAGRALKDAQKLQRGGQGTLEPVGVESVSACARSLGVSISQPGRSTADEAPPPEELEEP